MRRIQLAKALLQTVATAALLTLFEFDKARLELQLTSSMYWILFAILVPFSAGLTFVGDFLIGRFRILRRLILWSDDIEGDWTDFTLDRVTGELINVAWIRIEFREGGFRLDGTAWYPPYGSVMTWVTDQSEFSGRSLLYRYRTNPYADFLAVAQGAGYVQFIRPPFGSRYQEYRGHFVDLYHLRECVHFGEIVRFPMFGHRLKSETDMYQLALNSAQRRLADARKSLMIHSKKI